MHNYVCHYYYLGVTQQPVNTAICEGSNAVLCCVTLVTSINNVTDITNWFRDDNPPVAVQPSLNMRFMINNIRYRDEVTSELTIKNVSLNDNGTGYFCHTTDIIQSNVAVITVASKQKFRCVCVCVCVCVHIHM